MDYLLLKHTHVTAVALSFSLFLLRGLWMLADSERLRQRWVRIVPHLVDTVLLASAIGMLLVLRLNPFTRGWLSAKIVALLVYIVLGSVALKRGRTKPIRVTTWLAALATFGYIAAVAWYKHPFPPAV
jgi:uncharacterized membrane protein SirB2